MNSSVDELALQIEQCLIADRHELQKILSAAKRNQRQDKPFDRLLARFQRLVGASSHTVALRTEGQPKPTYDENLPISAKRAEILQLIEKHQVIILAGETGSGKTTQLPKFCLELGRGRFGMVGHTQPRRLAARAVADRIAQELGVELGSTVGYQVRFNDCVSERSRLKLMTDGILLAEIQHDPLLLRYDTLIIDEAHERSLNIDFLLGYLKRVLPKRPDLKLIITSATIDLERFSRHFDNAPIMEVSGRTYPVEVVYAPLEDLRQQAELEDRDLDQPQAIVYAIELIEKHERDQRRSARGDVLVFLSGERDIRETADLLRKQQYRDTEILPLYARLSNAEQQRIFRPSGQGRRIVLSTNVAETSLTVPGIRYVIDPGFARISRYSYRSKVQRLPIEAVSQASANQRKGRCGRVADGVCIRLFSEDDFLSRPEFTDAEIVRTNLAAVILQMASLNLGPVELFPFIDPPDSRYVKDGVRLLQELNALDSTGALTSLGRQLGQLPVDPRIGRMVVEAANKNCLSEVLVIASALSIQDPRERPLDKQQQADEKHREYTDKDSDFISFLNLWNSFEQRRQELSANQIKNYCRKHFLAYMRMREWRDLHRQLHLACRTLKLSENKQPAEADLVHQSLLAGLLSHVGLRQESGEYLGARNRRFRIFPGSSVAKGRANKVKARWIMVAELVETSQLFGRVVAKIEPGWLEPLAQHLIKRTYSEPHWERKPAQVLAYEQQTLYGLPVVSKRKVHFGAIDPQKSQEIFVRSALVEGDFRTRGAFFAHNQALIKEVEALEDKSRRRDIVVDEQQLSEFYCQLLKEKNGESVVNGASFEQWRKVVEASDSQILFFSKEQLMQHGAESVNNQLYPDVFIWKGMSFPLSYQFDPTSVDDGVTISVPVGVLSRLPHLRLQWLVPGMLKQKCVAMLKALPKALRKNFVPIPDYVDAFLEVVVPQDEALSEVLGAFLRKKIGVRITPQDWRLDTLDKHHRMRIRVVDAKGAELDVGRSWHLLAEHFVNDPRALQAVNDQQQSQPVTDWDFGTLQNQVQLSQAGINITTFPALAVVDRQLCIQTFNDEQQAQQSHRHGVARLIQSQLSGQLKQLKKTLPKWSHSELLFAKVGGKEGLWLDFLDALIPRVFMLGGDLPRSEAAFRHCIKEGLPRLESEAKLLAEQLNQILSAYLPLKKALSAPVSLDSVIILNDIRSQLDHLIYRGFLCETPAFWFDRYDVYLQAIAQRMDKYPRDINRQRHYSEQLSECWQRYQQRVRSANLDGHAERREYYRWMIEEYRVSLFAQQLGTVETISAKRLEKIWRECG